MLADRRIASSFLGFLLLGMPYAAVGVAWPSMAGDLGRSLGDLGFVLVATTAGYMAATMANGFLTRWLGTGTVLPLASALATLSIALWAAAGSLGALLAGAVALGVGGGAIDAGINAYVAVYGSTSAMGWLHATFGLGSAIGPLVITVFIDSGASWRSGFWILAVAQLAVTVTFALTRRGWPARTLRTGKAPARLPRHLRPLLAVGLGAFALYTGVEVAAGEWSYSLFTEGRSVGIRAAGLLVTGYWATLTLGRVAMGIVGDRLTHRRLLAWSLGGTAAGSLLLWWSPNAAVGAAGLLMMGLFLAPVFPVLVLLTSGAWGAGYVPRAVGLQIAAAGAGAAILPGMIGALVGGGGIGVTGPVIAAGSILLLGAGAGTIALTSRAGAVTPPG